MSPAASPWHIIPPIRVGDLEIDVARRRVRVGRVLATLTVTESRLLEMLARRPGRAFTRRELAARVRGPGYAGIERTIDVHIANLRRKLARAGGARTIATIQGIGYCIPATDAPEDH